MKGPNKRPTNAHIKFTPWRGALTQQAWPPRQNLLLFADYLQAN